MIGRHIELGWLGGPRKPKPPVHLKAASALRPQLDRATIRAVTNAAAQDVPIGTRLGEYEVIGILGAGGMGTVYKGAHPIIGKEVAIKVLAPHLSRDEQMVQRFVQEARAVVKIQHINIIDVFAFGHEPTVGHYFIMPLLDGESLGDRMERGPMALIDVLPIIEQTADALDTAHEAGIYHRDLKPDNIYLATERKGPPSVRILDFGIAKLVESDMSATQTGVQMGTPLFMSPEQWEGCGVDHRTDIYALGVLVHHLITGRYPFEAKSHMALMNLHVNGEPQLPSLFGASEALDAVIARALAKNKEFRHATAREFYLELVDAAAGSDQAAAASRVVVAASATLESELEMLSRPPTNRRPIVFLGVAGAGLAAAALAFAVTRGRAQPETPIPVQKAAQTFDAGSAAADVAASDVEGALTSAVDGSVAAPAVATTPDAGQKTDSDRKKRPRDGKRVKASPLDTNNKTPEAKPPPKKPKPGDKSKWGDTVDPY